MLMGRRVAWGITDIIRFPGWKKYHVFPDFSSLLNSVGSFPTAPPARWGLQARDKSMADTNKHMAETRRNEGPLGVYTTIKNISNMVNCGKQVPVGRGIRKQL